MVAVRSRSVEVVLPRLHEGQRIVKGQARRHNWLAAGRRWRKTTLLVAVALEAALRGETWFWGAPTYDQVRIAVAEIARAMGGLDYFHAGEMTWRFPWRAGSIVMRSLDRPDNARGHTAYGVVLDEAAYVPAAAWQGILSPMLVDTGGPSWAISTPRGRNWFWREYMAAAESEHSRAWNSPTIGCEIAEDGRLLRRAHVLENPHISFEAMQGEFETLPERQFRQEYLAEFLEDGGGVFLGVEAVVDAGRNLAEPAAGEQYIMGVDLARVNDWTVLCVLTREGRQVAFERFNQISWERQLIHIRDLASRYDPCLLMLDSTGLGDPLYERLRSWNLNARGVKFTATRKEQLVNRLAIAIEHKLIRLMDVPIQTAELQAFEAEQMPSGLMRYHAPDGAHDDCVTALMLANDGVRRLPGYGAV